MTPQLRRIARRQGGCFTRQQALDLGVAPREVQRHLITGEWVVVLGDVLACAGTPVTEQMRAWSAVLAVGHPVALTGRSSALHHGLERVTTPVTPTLVVPNWRTPAGQGPLEVRRVVARQFHVVWRGGLPLLPVATTIRDLAADVDAETLRDIVQHALRRRRTSFEALTCALGRGLQGSTALRAVLEEVGPGFQVKWERLLHRAVLEEGVRMQPQTLVEAPDGRRAYLDLGIAALRFGVEIDGFLNHMARFAADRRRARMLALELDWKIAPYAVEELARDLTGVARDIARHVRKLQRLAA